MKRVLEFADKYNMLPEGTTVICAISGGADSVCLLHLLKSIAPQRGLKVYAAHFNHCLRGEESDRDEHFVRCLCREMDVELFCAAGDVNAYALEHGTGTEEAARALRYAYFASVAARLPGSRVATAHNADDNAETMLMNLSRGSGLKGLCGIPPVRDIYIRPMLCLSRADVISYLGENALPHVEDSTNSEDIYTRNRIRHSVIPALRTINPAFSRAALEAAELLREDEKLLESIARDAVPFAEDGSGRIIIMADKLTAAEYPLAARAVRAAAARLGCYPSAVHIRAVLELAAAAAPSGQTGLPGNILARREYDRLIIMRDYDEEKRKLTETELVWNNWVENGQNAFAIYFGAGKPGETDFDELFMFQKRDICGKISVRSRRAGDKICLDKRQGSKTLKKLFIEKKIPAAARADIPVIADEEKVLAIVSLGQSAEYKRETADCFIAVKKI